MLGKFNQQRLPLNASQQELTVGHSNHVDLQMLEEMGIKANPSVRQRRLSLKCVGLIIIASIRMRRLKEEWGKTVRVKERLMAALEQKRKKEYRSVG